MGLPAKTECTQEEEKITRSAALKTMSLLSYFMPQAELRTIWDYACSGEEQQHYRAKMDEMYGRILQVPVIYEQDGLGNEAIIHLHYFKDGMDFFITEKDVDREQNQAFGYSDIGFGPELGYISIQELVSHGVELDLYYAPRRVADEPKIAR